MNSIKKKANNLDTSTQEENKYSCKFRVYLNKEQDELLSSYLYIAQNFRNLAINYCSRKRHQRYKWIENNNKLPNPLDMSLIPKELKGNFVLHCSRDLTTELEETRIQLEKLCGLKFNKRKLPEILRKINEILTKPEIQELKQAIPFIDYLSIPRTILDQVLLDLDKTYKKAYKDIKTNSKKKANFPKNKNFNFASSVRMQISASKNKTYREYWEQGFIFIPTLGLIKFRDSKSLPSIPPELITISRNSSGQTFVSFLDKDRSDINNNTSNHLNNPLPKEKLVLVDNNILLIPAIDSVDLGLKTLAVTTKREIKRNKNQEKYEKRFKRIQRDLSRKQKGSRRYHKNRIKLAKIHEKIKNIRHDSLIKVAYDLVKNNPIICLENLTLGFMSQNKYLSKDSYNASFGIFRKYIYHFARKFGYLILECDKFDPSSKTCSNCHYYYKDLGKKRSWKCKGCNTIHDRDKNAAINIRYMALVKAINTLNASGNDVKALVDYELNNELKAFLEHGGLTSILEYLNSKVSCNSLNSNQGVMGCNNKLHSRSCEVLVLPNNSNLSNGTIN